MIMTFGYRDTSVGSAEVRWRWLSGWNKKLMANGENWPELYFWWHVAMLQIPRRPISTHWARPLKKNRKFMLAVNVSECTFFIFKSFAARIPSAFFFGIFFFIWQRIFFFWQRKLQQNLFLLAAKSESSRVENNSIILWFSFILNLFL